MHNSYILSEKADRDLEEIFDYTLANFGLNQTIEYIESIHYTCEKLTSQELMGISRPEIEVGMRSLVHRHHILFYKINLSEKVIRIERIIHGNRDILKNLQP